VPLPRGRERSTVATIRVIECVQAHYEVKDLRIGKVYRWCPESAVVECEECRKSIALTGSKRIYGECGADYSAVVEEILDACAEQHEVEHLWRSLRPYYDPIREDSLEKV
jgi:hypothetical protein